jgi:hypothetical protein
MATPDVHDGNEASWIGILSLIRLVRLLRLISLSKIIVSNTLWGRYSNSFGGRLNAMTVYVFALAYFMAAIINLEVCDSHWQPQLAGIYALLNECGCFSRCYSNRNHRPDCVSCNTLLTLQACIMVLIANLEGLENSWLTSATWEDFTSVSQPYQWYCAVYWVITTVRWFATIRGLHKFLQAMSLFSAVHVPQSQLWHATLDHHQNLQLCELRGHSCAFTLLHILHYVECTAAAFNVGVQFIAVRLACLGYDDSLTECSLSYSEKEIVAQTAAA